MSNRHSLVICFSILTIILPSLQPILSQQIAFDNFDDESDDGWFHDANRLHLEDAEWDPSGGEYDLRSRVSIPSGQFAGMTAMWEDSKTSGFQSGYLRAKVRVNSTASNIGLLLRSHNGDIANGYAVIGEAPKFQIQRCVEFDCIDMARPSERFRVGEDWWMEAGMADSVLSVKLWQDGVQEPQVPQYQVRDDDPLGPGFFGLGAAVPWDRQGKIDATFDIVSFRTNRIWGDFNGDDKITVIDLDLMRLGGYRFDVTGDGVTNRQDLDKMVGDLIGTWYGDSNGDGEFNTNDFVYVFQAGLYETDQPALWSQGDWNLDGEFDSQDLVSAFQGGGFEIGLKSQVVAVPEPEGITIVLVVATLVVRKRLSSVLDSLTAIG